MAELSTESLESRRRADLYVFLSSVYSQPPPAGIVELIRSRRLLDELSLSDDSPARAELAAFLDESAADPGLERDLTAEYTRLFVLPLGRKGPPIRPHESVFTDPQMRLGGKVTIGVKRFYDYAGAVLGKNCDEHPDHVGVEMEFMQFLCGIEVDAMDRGLAAEVEKCRVIQNDFLKEHLLRWIFDLCRYIRKESQSRFYAGVALMTEDFMSEEQTRLAGARASAG